MILRISTIICLLLMALLFLFLPHPSLFAAEVPELPVQKTMVVPYDGHTLSLITYVIGKTAHIVINGELDGTDELRLQKDVEILDALYDIEKVRVHLNSGGGLATSGFALADRLRQIDDKYDTSMEAYGNVQSAAVIVFLSVKKRTVTRETLFMVHQFSLQTKPSMAYSMPASEVETLNEKFKMMTERYARILADNSNLSVDEWKEKMKCTTYFWPEEGLSYGIEMEVK